MHFHQIEEDQALDELIDQLHQRQDAPGVSSGFELDDSWSGDLWTALTDTGLLGLLVPSGLGGGDGTVVQARIACEAMGRSLDVSPFVWSSVVSVAMLREAEDSELRAQLLRAIAEGAIVAPAYVGQRGELRTSGAQDPLRVPHGDRAQWILVPVLGERGAIELAVVESSRLPSRLTSVPRSDLQALSETTLNKLRLGVVDTLSLRPEGWSRATSLGRVALAAYALGAERRLVDLASDYARSRQQFGKPIGSFQAVAHRCSDLYVRAASDAVIVDLATWLIETDDGPSRERTSRLAKARALEGFAAAAASTLQVFGGHGFAMEGDVQRYFRRAQGLRVTWGSPASEYDEVAPPAIVPASQAVLA